MIKTILKKVNEKGFFHLLGSNFLISFLGFGVVLLLAKILTPKEIGNIKLIQSYAAFFIMFASFGYNISTLKLCSERRTKIEKIKILALSTKRIIFFSLLSILLLVSLSYSGILSNDQSVANWLIVYSLVIPFAALGYNFVSYFQAIKEIKKMAKIQVVIRLQFIFVIIFATYFFGFKGLIFSTILSYIIGTLVYLKSTGLRFTKFFYRTGNYKKFDHYAVFAVLGSLITLIGQYSDMYLIDYLESDRSLIGLYSLATVFFIGATVVIGTVQSIVTPYFSENETNKHWQKKNWIKYQLLAVLVSIFTAIGMYTLISLLIEFYFGLDYLETKHFVLLLMIKFIVWSTYAITGAALAGLGKIKQGFYLVCFSVPLNVFLGYFFYFKYGIDGIVFAQILVNLLVMFISTIYMWKVINENN